MDQGIFDVSIESYTDPKKCKSTSQVTGDQHPLSFPDSAAINFEQSRELMLVFCHQICVQIRSSVFFGETESEKVHVSFQSVHWLCDLHLDSRELA